MAYSFIYLSEQLFSEIHIQKPHFRGVLDLVRVKRLIHVPRTRNFIFKKQVFKRKFPCESPLDFLTLDRVGHGQRWLQLSTIIIF